MTFYVERQSHSKKEKLNLTPGQKLSNKYVNELLELGNRYFYPSEGDAVGIYDSLLKFEKDYWVVYKVQS